MRRKLVSFLIAALFSGYGVTLHAEYRNLQVTESWLLWLTQDGMITGLKHNENESNERGVSLAAFLRANSRNSFIALVANHDRALALRQDGSIYGFGSNRMWSLGQSVAEHRMRPVAPWERFTTDNVEKPRLIFGALGARQMAVGGGHSLAVLEDGALCAWGFDDVGQTGLLLDEKKQLVPWRVAGLPPIRMAAAGDGHSLALDMRGRVWAWGLDNAGQLGDGLLDNRHQPRVIEGLDSVVEIAAGAGHSLALDETGKVWSWGSNSMGELGRRARDPSLSRIPGRIKELPPILKIVAGDHFSAALDKKGWLWWWGGESHLPLGEPGQLHRLTEIGPIDAVAAFSGGIAISKKKSQNLWIFLQPFDKKPLLVSDGKATAH